MVLGSTHGWPRGLLFPQGDPGGISCCLQPCTNGPLLPLSQQQASPLTACSESTSCRFCNWEAPKGDWRLEPGKGTSTVVQPAWLQQLRTGATNSVQSRSARPGPACSPASWASLLSPQTQAPALQQAVQSSQHQPGSSSELLCSGDPTPLFCPLA